MGAKAKQNTKVDTKLNYKNQMGPKTQKKLYTKMEQD